MHDACSEHVVRKKHRGTPHTKALFECYDDGRDTVGSLSAEVIIFLRKDTKFGVAGIVKSAGEYPSDT
jgi:hypothetical protein